MSDCKITDELRNIVGEENLSNHLAMFVCKQKNISFEFGKKRGKQELLKQLRDEFQPDVRMDFIYPQNLEIWIDKKNEELEKWKEIK